MRSMMWLASFLIVCAPALAHADVVSEAVAISTADTAFIDFDHHSARVAVHGDRALVAWLDARDFGDRGRVVRFELVDLTDGSFDPPGVLLDDDREPDTHIDHVLWAGEHFLVFYSVRTRRRVARIDVSGRVLDQRPTEIAGAVASDGATLLAASTVAGHLFVTRVSALGTALELPGQRVVTDTVQSVLGLVHDGHSFVVFYTDSRDDDHTVRALRLGADGASMGAEIALAVPHTATVASDGASGTLLTWSASEAPFEVRAAHLDSDDELSAPHLLDTGTRRAAKPPAVAPVRDGYLVAYDLDGDPHVIAVDTRGAPTSTAVEVPTQVGREITSLAGGDTQALLAVGGSSAFRLFRLSESGVLLDDEGWSAAAGATTDAAPSVAFNLGGFLVGWARAPLNPARDRMQVARVELDGQVGPAIGLGAGNELELAPVADGFVATWDDPAASPGSVGGGYPVRRRLDADGLPLNDQFGHQAGARYHLASNGTDYVVAWTDDSELHVQPSPGAPVVTSPVTGELRGLVWTGSEYVVVLDDGGLTFVLADATGALVDVTARRISTTPAADVSVAADGAVLVVAWIDEGLHHAVLQLDGQLLGSDRLALPDESYRDTSATFDGADFVVAFVRSTVDGTDVGALRITTTGAASQPFDVSASDRDEAAPAVASDGAGVTLVAYTDTTPDGARELRARFVRASTPGETGTPCQASAECTSGYCVDGVCCESACGDGDTGDCQACSVRAGGVADGRCRPLSAGAVCRAAAQGCDTVEVCDGVAEHCPTDRALPVGARCDDGNPCTHETTCRDDGACVGTTVVCDDGQACDPQMCCSTFSANCAMATNVCTPSQHCAPVSGCTAPAFEACAPAPPPDGGDDVSDVVSPPDDALDDASPDATATDDTEVADPQVPPGANQGDDGCGCSLVDISPGPRHAQVATALCVLVALLTRRRRRRESVPPLSDRRSRRRPRA